MTQRFDVDVFALSDRASFFSDRWGDANISTEGTRSTIEEAGFTPDDIRAITDKHASAFQSETTFLIHAPDAPWARSDDKTEKLALFVEFEIDIDYLPGRSVIDSCDQSVIKAWKRTSDFWAPAMAHLARGIAAMGPVARDIRPMFNLDAPYGASTSAIVPLHAAECHATVEDLLYSNGIAFPPSHHVRLEAIGALRWRLDASIPSQAFPDPQVKLDWPVRQPA